jgi:3-isopropylmalate/(R)-2-methylmalate dehydratase large subunit
MPMPEQGIVHVVGPEQGFSLPGATIVCGDSHTACHGGLARWPSASAPARSSMCWRRRRCCSSSRRPWKCASRAKLGPGVTPKDLILHIIGVIGTAGGTGHVIEYRGSVFER